jgi:phosphoenolpyruvate---glycerone phosphotransferase subunit DhaL
MSGVLTTDGLRAAIGKLLAHIEKHADALNALDGTLGDGDLGVTLLRGLQTVAEQTGDLPADVGAAFLQCAKAFVSISGSTYGTLMATGMMSVAKATQGKTEVSWLEAPVLLGGVIEAMQRRGKAQLGDKTVLDTIAATQEAVREVTKAEDALPAAISATRMSIDLFREHQAQQGRARIFGEGSIGKDDPGMVAWLTMLEGLVA